MGNRKRISSKNPVKPVATSSGLKIVESLDRKVLSLLNELGSISEIRIKGSQAAEADSWNIFMGDSFRRICEQGNHFKSRLLSEIKLFGGAYTYQTPGDKKLQKSWEAILHALKTDNKEALKLYCRENESLTIKAYELILKSGAYIPHNIQEFIQEEIHQLKHEFRKIISDLAQVSFLAPQT